MRGYRVTRWRSTSTIFSMAGMGMNSWMEWKLRPPVERLGQGRPADGDDLRGDAGLLHGGFGIADEVHMAGELFLHIIVAVGHLQGEGVGAVLAVHVFGGLRHQRFACLELFPVVVPDDIGSLGGGLIALHFTQVEKSLVALGMGGGFGGGQQPDELGQQQGGVFHLIFGAAGVDIEPVDGDGRRSGIEVFVFDLAQLAAINGIGLLCGEAFHTETVGAPADLLIGGEADGDGAVLDFRVGDEHFAQGDDLRNAGLVIGAQQGGAVGDDELLPDVIRQKGVIDGGEGGGTQFQHAAGVGDDAGLDVVAGDGGAGIHVGDEPEGFAFAGEITVHIAVGILLDIGKADGL